MSELAKRLKAVDPNLTVISGHRRRKRRSDFDRPGPVCSRCGQETMRFLNGVCPRCDSKDQFDGAKKMELKARERDLLSIFRARRRAARR